MEQHYWDDVFEGEALVALEFPLSVYRLIMAAGANRDFNSIHHNAELAKASGAPDMYANTFFLQGMWEKCVRQYIGLGSVIRKMEGFQMKIFNTAGDTVTVSGRVLRKWREDKLALVEIELMSVNAQGVSVGPGRITASMPARPIG